MIVNRSMDLTYITHKAYRVVDIGREVTVTSTSTSSCNTAYTGIVPVHHVLT